MRYLICLSLCLSMLSFTVFANNLTVQNATLTNKNTASHTYDIRFDVSWDNSWYISGAPSLTANWDAAWLFAKYSTYTSGAWSAWTHCKLLNTGYTAPSGSQMSFGTDGTNYTGAFIYRDSADTGTVNWTNAAIRWDYGTDGVSDATPVKIKLFGIEMVYIPEGTFNLNSAASASMYNEFLTSGGSITQITNENALDEAAIRWAKDSTQGGQGNDNGSSYGSDALGASYPKGYNDFYSMKYEISQGQYADFLNMLTSAQASTRYPNYNGTNRHTISGTWPNYSASRPDRACNFIGWVDVTGYADWASLRPMTELEFEKICRGGQSVVTNEYPWGVNSIVSDEAFAISGTEDGTEIINTDVSLGAANYGNNTFSGGDGGAGPLRCGIFAKSDTTKVTAGAGYYGVMEMAGSVYERGVTVAKMDHTTGGGATTEAGLFDGSHGNGALDSSGNPDVSTWPGTDALGAGFFGGAFSSTAYIRTSDRTVRGLTHNSRAANSYGGRCVRTAP